MQATQTLFETVPCPLCGGSSFEVVRASKYNGAITAGDLRSSYSASSSHILLDQVVRCAGCSLQYVNPRPHPDLVIESYEAAEDPLFVSQNDGRIATFRRLIRGILNRLGEKDGGGRRILDIGCAGGAFLVAAREAGFEAVGVEPSRWLADFGRRTYNLNIHNGILRPGMFPEGSFDVVTLWDVLEHVSGPGELLGLVNKLLKKGGLLVLSYPDVDSLAARLMGSRWPFWLSVHLLYYNRDTIRKQLNNSGFEPLWLAPMFQRLSFGYVIDRAIPYLGALKLFRPLISATGLARLPFTYNMGQTLAVSRKK